jgi:hypothetical protein
MRIASYLKARISGRSSYELTNVEKNSVILSEVAGSRSEAAAEWKDPYAFTHL